MKNVSARKLNVSKLAQIAADYQKSFPDWQLVARDSLVRFSNRIAQVIWFDRVRTGAYRPTCRVHILVAPGEGGGTVVLPQFLSIKVREISPQAHAQSLSAVVAALKSEILPSLSKPLDEHSVAELLSERSMGRPANAYALSCLLAALGRSGDALRRIGEYRNAIVALGLAPQPVDAERDAFLKKVEEWLKLSEREVYFAEVVKQQKARLLQRPSR